MNAVATIPAKSVTIDMANRYGMEPSAFEQTLRQTIMPMSRGSMIQPTREEFAAFLLVAREYRLNPITRQIYAFPKKGGGIIPVVSVDGWAFLINEHPAFDGMEFEDIHDDKGALLSVTCRIFRKDRRMPVSVTEYLSECKRDTEPWQMRHRMLRHKALIQCARYAFAFSGIYDEDEAEKFAAIPNAAASMRTDSPPPAPRREVAPQPAQAVIEHRPAESAGAPEHIVKAERAAVDAAQEHDADGVVSMESLLTELDERLGYAKTADDVEEAYTDFDAEPIFSDYDGGVQAARTLKAKHLDRVPAPRKLTGSPTKDLPEAENEMLREAGALPSDGSDFPGNDAIEKLQAGKDPFVIPETFKGGGHYQIFITDACKATTKPEHEDLLRAAWGKTGEIRKELHGDKQLHDVDIQRLKDGVLAAIARLQDPAPIEDAVDDALPPPAPRAQQPQEPRKAADSEEAPPPAPKAATGDPAAEYGARMEVAFAAAKTKEDVDKFWFGTVADRDAMGGGDPKWKIARSKAKNALPSEEA